MRSNLCTLIVIALLGSITTQEFGQRIGRRKNFGIKSDTTPKVAEPLRTGRQNQGYTYPKPDNPLLLPSSSNQDEQHHQITAIKSEPSQVIQQELELQDPPLVEVVDISIQRAPEQTLLQPAAQNFVPVQQPIDDEIAFWDFRESIPGDPEHDYPILDKIPRTSFKCDGQIDGYYADVETRCQVFHVCTTIPDAEPIKASFLCPNGTIFNQEVFVCQWWPDVDCASSSQYFDLNKNIGVVPESSQTYDARVSNTAHQTGTAHQS